MKTPVLSVILVLSASVLSSVFAQVAPPPGAGTPAGGGDKNLGQDNIKMRSVELERVKRDELAAEAALFAPINKEIAAKFSEIKEDFEGLQILEAAIIKAYTTGTAIDYRLIEISADGINQKAKRLDANLFDAKKVKEQDKPANGKPVGKAETTADIKELIVELDKSIGNFVSSKMFGNLNVIEPEDAIVTRNELDNIRQLSLKLSEESKKKK